MASRFEQVTDIDKILALRSAGLLYYMTPTGRPCLLRAKELTQERQKWMCCLQDYYVLVEEDESPITEDEE